MPAPSSTTASTSKIHSQHYITSPNPQFGMAMPSKKTPSSSSTPDSTQHIQTQSLSSPPRPATNIWQLMGYPIPRGPCRHKPGMLSSTCACLRFMLNPVVAGSTFCCDGCGHHASYHVLQGEYATAGGEETMGMGVGKMIQQQQQHQQQNQQQLQGMAPVQMGSAMIPGKGRGKRVVELDFNGQEVGEDEIGVDWLDGDVGELTVLTRSGNRTLAKVVPKRRGIGASPTHRHVNGRAHTSGGGNGSGNGNGNGNGTPVAKRSRV